MTAGNDPTIGRLGYSALDHDGPSRSSWHSLLNHTPTFPRQSQHVFIVFRMVSMHTRIIRVLVHQETSTGWMMNSSPPGQEAEDGYGVSTSSGPVCTIQSSSSGTLAEDLSGAASGEVYGQYLSLKTA
ncbi:hypothetical protein HRR83_007883 [Exophiala dermatitidis]|uniref:Uncharacterized protein n=1 Tax=Exophiala dermatitidis TaxID=5970 RepID=A0AAN6EVD5_EXODE|nr:hypothetical protein HRR74_007462 [Exophiala dermatitidis]KAJ4510122.1 hypothetical protein HRR73_006920 [Exophiala dermatitidis]KAJ4539125.1 hypothetical protein HRR77_006541 [Exophiala dermatitidis]KAJ4540594.1 hypothetical protein HRR76_003981 [Exophiala dermatitidis]KAJ4564573.1 hypothetical protein HRR79_005833 [Exophiala dermatitidis]